ncbi:MAG: hypothetical protein EP298_08635 [Gammaproteobacteria bacterium]|nr:MAG: hypothetical protein EP298_08635 [Gammaproteobacteria bacterium]UTW42812.1 hypothetical protein KFE69_01325 [bacterium SCSIO 12844]
MYALGFLSILLGGLLNGSFVIPSRFIKHHNNEQIWLYYTAIGLILIPWLLLLVIYPKSINLYYSIGIYNLSLLIVSGLIFGIGQVCFFYAIDKIGIAASFAVNLGIGVILGSLFVIGYQSMLFSYRGNLICIAIILILLSLWINYKLNHLQQKKLYKNRPNQNTQLCWLLALFAGIASGLQNISFIIVSNHSHSFVNSTNSYWYWPLFLSIAAIPMFIGFLIRYKKNHLLNLNHLPSIKLLSPIPLTLIAMMGLCFSGSLILYSLGMSLFTQTEIIDGWPILMITIILTSQVWGIIFDRVKQLSLLHKFYRFISIIVLIVAIILISLSH